MLYRKNITLVTFKNGSMLYYEYRKTRYLIILGYDLIFEEKYIYFKFL